MKIGFLTDTNFFTTGIHNSHESKYLLKNMDIFIDYVSDLRATKSKHKLFFCVPDLVFEELKYQKIYDFENSYKSFKEKYDLLSYGLSGELPIIDLNDALENEISLYKRKVFALTIDFSKDLFQEVISDSLKKNPPFSKNSSNTGFKDSLIWKTVLYSESINEFDDFYFFSCDKIFSDNFEYLNKEFKIHHPNTNLEIKYIDPDGSKRQKVLEIIINKYNLHKTDVVKLYNNDSILPIIKEVNYTVKVEDDISYYLGDGKEVYLTNINFYDFGIDDFYIDSVVKEENKFLVKLVFRTLNYEYFADSDVSEKKYLLGNVDFEINEVDNKYNVLSFVVSGIDFDLGVVDLLRGISLKGISNFASELSKTIKENYRINFEVINPLKELQESLKNLNSSSLSNIKLNNVLDELKDNCMDTAFSKIRQDNINRLISKYGSKDDATQNQNEDDV